MKTPKCYDSDAQFVLWHEAAKRSVKQGKVAKWLICEDCTNKYKAAMLDAGRCGNPGYVVTPKC